MRSMAHPDYVYTPWSAERRAKHSERVREGLGRPQGLSVVYGLYVPREHAKVIAYFAKYVDNNHRSPIEFIRGLEADGWARMGKFNELYADRLEIRKNRELLRALDREIWRAN